MLFCSGSLSGALSFIGLNRGCCASQFLPPDELFAESEAIHPRRAAALNFVAALEGYGHSGIGARDECSWPRRSERTIRLHGQSTIESLEFALIMTLLRCVIARSCSLLCFCVSSRFVASRLVIDFVQLLFHLGPSIAAISSAARGEGHAAKRQVGRCRPSN